MKSSHEVSSSDKPAVELQSLVKAEENGNNSADHDEPLNGESEAHAANSTGHGAATSLLRNLNLFDGSYLLQFLKVSLYLASDQN